MKRRLLDLITRILLLVVVLTGAAACAAARAAASAWVQTSAIGNRSMTP
jgi:hypothetical protein